MCIRLSLYLLSAFCVLLAKSDDALPAKEPEATLTEEQPSFFILPPSYGLFQRQPVMMGRNNLAFFIPAFTTTTTTTSTITCTYSTAAQCIGRRRRELTIEEHGDLADNQTELQENENSGRIREERKADPSFIADPYLSYPQYHPRYVIEPSFERSSYFQFPQRFRPSIAPQPDMARFLFGGGLITFTSTTTITTTSSWRPICAFPGAFQACPAR